MNRMWTYVIISLSLLACKPANQTPEVNDQSTPVELENHSETSEKEIMEEMLVQQKPVVKETEQEVELPQLKEEIEQDIDFKPKEDKVIPVDKQEEKQEEKPAGIEEKRSADTEIEVSKELIEEKEITQIIDEKTPVLAGLPKEVGDPDPQIEITKIQSLSHASFDQLLNKYVSKDGKVNYKGFKSEVSVLDEYLQHLSDNPIQSSWDQKKQLAYWINVYNAFTIKLILNHYPVNSITDLEGGKPWDKTWIQLAGKTYSLNQIENEIIRPTYNEPRIHFAVNCAAKSCPPLLNKAWTAQNLESNLERQTKSFINNPSYNMIESGQVSVSKIFEWYAQDFGNLIDYLNQYSQVKIDAGAQLDYVEYNWKLNE